MATPLKNRLKPPGRGQRGFTLVELLMAITLLAMILTLAYQGLRVGTQAVSRGEELVDRTNRMRIVHQFLRNQLSRVLPLALGSNEDADGEAPAVIMFEGEDDRMRFVAPMPGYLSRGGPHEQVLALRRGSNGMELVFAHRLLGSFEDGDALDDRDNPPIVLIDGIESGRFNYLTIDEEGEPTDWSPDWEDPSVTPLMVQVDLTMNSDSRLVWPILEVAPLIDGTATRRNRSLVIPNQPTRRTDDPDRPIRRSTDL